MLSALQNIFYASDDEKVRGEYLKSVFDWVEQDDRICGVVFWNNNTSEDRMYHFSDNEYLMDIWYDGARRLHEGN